MYKILFWICSFVAVAVFFFMLWAISEITKYDKSEPATEEKQKEEHDHVQFWFWLAVGGFFSELFLCLTICALRKKVNPCGESEIRIADNYEIEMNRLHGIPPEALGRGRRDRRSARLGEAYEPNRIEVIAARIVRAAEDIDTRIQRSDHYVPVPTEEPERY